MLMDLFGLFKRNAKKIEEKEKLKKLLREKYGYFQRVLNYNNYVLTYMADLEEKFSGEYLFDMAYIKTTVNSISEGVHEIIKNLNALANNKYLKLEEIYQEIKKKIEKILTSKLEIPATDLTIPIEFLNKNSVNIAGGKIAHLAELKNVLDIPTPEGFVVTSYAFIKFLENTGLKDKIAELLETIDINKIAQLNEASKKIQELIINSEVPEELQNSIKSAYKELCKKTNKKCMVSVRSSAIYEDSDFSFAGQYSSYLNIPEEMIIYYYKKVIASLFNPRAIFYYKTKGFSEAEMVMAVGILSMINAKAGGVIYSKNPNNSQSDNIIINAVRGLGKLVVNGSVTAETYVIRRNPEISILEKIPGSQNRMLLCKEDGGIEEVFLQGKPLSFSLTDEEIISLAKMALKIEKYYGCPQDIEWAIDENRKIFILQARPLRIIKKSPSQEFFYLQELRVIISFLMEVSLYVKV